MDKRYQVFVSSTYLDLVEERQSVLKAILELDHMPAGMELFPASDDTAWRLIQDVIDASDYYALIVGGRYGSVADDGLGFTEKEYDYAIQKKKPIIALLCKDPSRLPRARTDTAPGAWKKLLAFRQKVEKVHTCVFWDTAEELKSKVITGLTSAIKRYPAAGWVRADQVPSEATVSTILKLKNRINELEQAAAVAHGQPPVGTESLARGEDEFELHFSFSARKSGEPSYIEGSIYSASISPTWNSIFASVAPLMITEASDGRLRSALSSFFEEQSRKAYRGSKRFKDYTLHDFSFMLGEVETCVVQFRALGLISESDRKRSIKQTGTYWTLTPYGNTLMTQLRAVHRVPIHGSKPVPGGTSDT